MPSNNSPRTKSGYGTLLQNNSFLLEIEENLTLDPCKEASTKKRSKQRNFIYNPTKKNNKLGDL